jgi:hypothetical protein
VFSVESKTECGVHVARDTSMCWITGNCFINDVDIVIVDYTNKRVKLLEHSYKVVGHCDVAGDPWCVCKVSPYEVAVTVNADDDTHMLQFIFIANGQLELGRTMQMHHDCLGIVIHRGALYVTSATGLYKYSLSGGLISKLYEERTGGWPGNRHCLACYIRELLFCSLQCKLLLAFTS